jgi:hypothetical protein
MRALVVVAIALLSHVGRPDVVQYVGRPGLKAAGPGHVFSQSGLGAIWVKVTDSSESPIPGATVTLIGPNTRLASYTNISGEFQKGSLVPATYRIEIALTGFETIKNDVQVAGGAEITWTAKLIVGRMDGISFDEEIQYRAGRDPIDCGRHEAAASRDAIQKSIDCVASAVSERRGFVTVQRVVVNSSRRDFVGFLGRSGERAQFLTSAPVGRLTLTECARPTIEARDGQFRFACLESR